MSDSSTQSRHSGSGGPRRSGNNRRRNNNRNRNRNRRGGGGGGGQQQGRRSGSGRRPPREPKPIPLTWWQKILKAIGLYKEPVRPPRKRKDSSAESSPKQPAKKAPKSGTRVAKTAEGNRAAKPKPVDSTRLYLGNLSYDASEYDLEDLFKGVGAVRNVEIVYNRNTHKSKGYGFIEMATIDEAKRAVEVLHDQPFMGRKLIVSGAKSKGPADDDRDGDRGNNDGDRGDDAGGDSEENS